MLTMVVGMVVVGMKECHVEGGKGWSFSVRELMV